MGLMKLLSHILTAWIAFLHPCFASFKALSNRPVSEPDLERWVKYWSIVGAIVGVEYALEWLVSWVPFYWEIKTVFILYLALPQTQGSTYIYDMYLAPYFKKNETAIEAGITNAEGAFFLFLQGKLIALWDMAWKVVAQVQAAQPPQSQPGGGGGSGGGATPAPAAGSPADAVSNLWRTFGPSFIASLTSASATARPPPPPNSAVSQSEQIPTPQSSSSASTPGTQAHTRSPFTSGTE